MTMPCLMASSIVSYLSWISASSELRIACHEKTTVSNNGIRRRNTTTRAEHLHKLGRSKTGQPTKTAEGRSNVASVAPRKLRALVHHPPVHPAQRRDDLLPRAQRRHRLCCQRLVASAHCVADRLVQRALEGGGAALDVGAQGYSGYVRARFRKTPHFQRILMILLNSDLFSNRF